MLRDAGIVIVGALMVSMLLRMFVVQLFDVPSESMENTIMAGDHIAVTKIGGVQRGDIVVFEDRLGWLPPSDVEENTFDRVLIFMGLAPDDARNYLVKRVIGLPGDHLVCCDAQSRIMINDLPVNAQSYLYINPITGEQDDPSTREFDIVVPKDGLFVAGDHRSDSQDSRYHLCQKPLGDPDGSLAIVPRSAVIGTVSAIVYPFSRFTTLERPSVFDGVPDPAEPAPDNPIITVGC